MRIASLCVVVIALAQLGATDCDGGIIRDPNYDLWCGDSLCAWKVARGYISRTATWHDGDPGVLFITPDTTIEQFTPVNSRDGACIRFDLIAHADESAQVTLDVDIYGDGTIERSFALGTSAWQPVSYRFAVVRPYTGIRFAFTMHNYGRVILARMRAQVLDDIECAGIEPLRGGPAPLGAICATAGDCASQICLDNVLAPPTCAACDPLAPTCTGGQVCGLDDPGPPERAVPLACVDAGARELAEGCFADAECAGHICQFGICSTCRTDGECGSGEMCRPTYLSGPSMCVGTRSKESRAPCANDFECLSGACIGKLRRQCLDGRSCASDANCPVDDSLVPSHCLIVGVQGGTCD
jgi:hypothetical protein